jgi:hypothetical protein
LGRRFGGFAGRVTPKSARRTDLIDTVLDGVSSSDIFNEVMKDVANLPDLPQIPRQNVHEVHPFDKLTRWGEICEVFITDRRERKLLLELTSPGAKGSAYAAIDEAAKEYLMKARVLTQKHTSFTARKHLVQGATLAQTRRFFVLEAFATSGNLTLPLQPPPQWRILERS